MLYSTCSKQGMLGANGLKPLYVLCYCTGTIRVQHAKPHHPCSNAGTCYATARGCNKQTNKPVALLLDVVVDDARQLLLPDLEPVDVHVVLDILKRAPEAVHLLAQNL